MTDCENVYSLDMIVELWHRKMESGREENGDDADCEKRGVELRRTCEG